MDKNISQSERDSQFIKRAELLTGQGAEFIAYFIGLVSCLAVHILYLVLFALNGVRAMAYFNVFSVLFYGVSIVLVKVVKEKLTLVYWALAEIIVHASAATWCVGLDADFAMFLLMIIPIAFMMPNKNKAMPFVIMGISTALYGVCHFMFRDNENVLYPLASQTAEKTFYIINIIIGSFVMIYVTSIYTVLNIYMESKLRQQTEQLRVMACVDPLTKLSNRRAMWDDLKRTCAESAENGTHYVIGLGDIDNFKKVNDTYGHDRGDEVLATIAKLIRENLPEDGCAARWGGEEFLFVFRGNVHDGLECAEKILQTIRERRFTGGEADFSVTMTVGLCEGVREEDIEQIISMADKRLYKGKNNGKDHVEYTD